MKPMRPMRYGLVLCLAAVAVAGAGAEVPGGSVGPAVQAVNALGIDLLRKGTAPGANALLSPYSIQSALAMTYAGAAGETRSEMARVLHYAGDEAALHQAFARLQQQVLVRPARKGADQPPDATLNVANRLFGQLGYEFRAPFLALTKDTYGAPLELTDFQRNPQAATGQINTWVANQTSQRIRDLIPPGNLTRDTRLVLVNAVYLKAPWVMPFSERLTQAKPFQLGGGKTREVPTMASAPEYFGYAQRDGYRVLTLPYRGADLQFLILLPDAPDGLAALEQKLTPDLLTTNANPGRARVKLHLPKFKLEPPLLKLSDALKQLGLKSVFDEPRGSANFDRMSPRKPDDYLFISEVFHKTFLDLDEKGTEAAAATAVGMMRATSVASGEPVEVRVDRPFLFAIQHPASGACWFLGRMSDPAASKN